MSVKLRLKRIGHRNKPYYRIVAADGRAPRDGKFIETIGIYQPLAEEPRVEVKEERALHWLLNGAQPSDTVRSILKKKGVMKRLHEEKLKRKDKNRIYP